MHGADESTDEESVDMEAELSLIGEWSTGVREGSKQPEHHALAAVRPRKILTRTLSKNGLFWSRALLRGFYPEAQ